MTAAAFTKNLRSERLVLRPLRPADASRITDLVNDPRVYRMLSGVPAHQNVAQTLAWMSPLDARRAADTAHVFGIESGGELVGVVSGERDRPPLPFSIGYWLAPDCWGRGYMTEAAATLIDWLKQRSERAFIAGYFADNPASGRVLSKLGFLKAGRMPKFCLGRGETVDHFDMARIG